MLPLYYRRTSGLWVPSQISEIFSDERIVLPVYEKDTHMPVDYGTGPGGDAELREQMGSAPLRRVHELFTIEKMVAEHERLYVEVTTGSVHERFMSSSDSVR